MGEMHRWFARYDDDHRNPVNRAIHGLCVPLMTWSVVALLWVIPVPAMLGRQGLWAAAAMLAAFVFYQRLSRPIALAIAAAFIVAGLACEGLFRWLGAHGLLWLALALLALALLGQFIGYRLEGRTPPLLREPAYLLIGPAWWMGKLLRRFGVRC